MKYLYPWQHESWQVLQGLHTHLPNALLLKGAQGIGKLDLALNFAHALLCSHSASSGMACGKCDSCHWLLQGNHPDFRIIQPAALTVEEPDEKVGGKKPSREITVEQIRDLSAFSNLSAHRGDYRVVIICPAETMNLNAANSLLKTLEEPSDKLLFLLVTHRPQHLLPTILSRCLGFTVNTPSREIGAAWLTTQGVKNPHHALAQTGFSPLQALVWAEQGEGADARQLLLNALQQPKTMDALSLADSLQRSKPIHIIHCLQQWTHDLYIAKLTGQVRYFSEYTDAIDRLANDAATQTLLSFQRDLQEARRSADHPLNAKLVSESLLISYLQLFQKS
ncbi:MAG: DNA polymerase III subunit delta' [Sideroxydans sp.]|nr:DNA polymerase III subunit delta' [Sideroxydans sp.]